MHLLHKSIMLLVALSALALSIAGTAAAANNVIVSPGGNVVGNGTSSWELQLGTSGRTFNCANATFTATLNTGGTGVTLPFAISTNYQQRFSNCVASGGISYNDVCTATAALSTTGITVGGGTPLSITGLTCTITLGGGGGCTARLTGGLTAGYTNGANQLTIPTTGQTIVISGSTCPGVVPNGPATFAAAGGGAFTYAVTPPTTITVV